MSGHHPLTIDQRVWQFRRFYRRENRRPLFGFFGIRLSLPAAAVLSVLVRFAYNRYLAEHPELHDAKNREQGASAGETTP